MPKTQRRKIDVGLMVPLIRVLASSILVFAAVAKLMFAPSILAGGSLLSNRVALSAAIGIEAGCSVIVFCGSNAVAWRAILGLHIPLLLAAVYSWMQNRDCGCFGVALPVEFNIALNLALISSAVCTRCHWKDATASTGSQGHVDKGAVLKPKVLICALTVVALSTAMSLWSIQMGLYANKCIRLLVAREWCGRQFPIIKQHTTMQQLKKGKWLVLVLDSNCQHCVQVANIVRGARQKGDLATVSILVLVSGKDVWPANFHDVELSHRTENVVDWGQCGQPFVANPAFFVLNDGIVEDAEDGPRAERALEMYIAGTGK